MKPFEKETYFVMALDPVHVGTGGYRLGRVDNTITRDPGTNLPKVPGSSIAGATRAYTAMAVQNVNTEGPFERRNGELYLKQDIYAKMAYLRPLYEYKDKNTGLLKSADGIVPLAKKKDDKEIYHSCAGKGAEDGMGHCGEANCPVCVAFGFSKKGNSFQGLAQFYDARILFFPVHSSKGPIWVTCPAVLDEHKVLDCLVAWEQYRPLGGNKPTGPLNFGWLHLAQDTSQAKKVDLSSFAKVDKTITNNLFLVSDKVFTRIVNDNLEVRTSVAINPATGAAEDGALYTFEAIPRGTVLWFDIIYNKPEFFRINGSSIIDHGKASGNGYQWVKENVEKGLGYLESLGVGGMNTRGMGRLRWLKGGAQ